MKLNAEILEEAAHWLVELNSTQPDLQVRKQFDAWLRRSPEHLRAYLELLPAWEDGAALPVHSDLAIEDLIAMGKRGDGNVVCLDSAPQVAANALNSRAAPGSGKSWLALAASVLFIPLAGLLWSVFFQGHVATDIGEQRSIALEDGSTINLNADSKIRVRYGKAQRTVELIEGQALFRVAKDAARPFVVRAGDTMVRAVGTQFDINRRRQSTVVTVVEGTVAVLQGSEPARSGAESSSTGKPEGASAQVRGPAAPESAPIAAERAHGQPTSLRNLESFPGELLLSAGEQITVGAAEVPARAVRTSIAAATAWTQRRLVFDDSTLGAVIEEFNRYNERRLVIRDPQLESFPITAAFSSPDPAPLVRFLEAQPAIRVVTTNHEIQIATRH